MNPTITPSISLSDLQNRVFGLDFTQLSGQDQSAAQSLLTSLLKLYAADQMMYADSGTLDTVLNAFSTASSRRLSTVQTSQAGVQ